MIIFDVPLTIRAPVNPFKGTNGQMLVFWLQACNMVIASAVSRYYTAPGWERAFGLLVQRQNEAEGAGRCGGRGKKEGAFQFN